MKTRRPSWSSVVLALILAGAGGGAVWLSGPPAPLGEHADESVFAAGRAMRHVRAIAQRPHPMGSADHARVREYLLSELQLLGFAVERQRVTGIRVRRTGVTRPAGTITAGRVENLMVRLPGEASTGAVLLASHYDSVAAGPGAADDASGVAAVLETLRVLRRGGRLRNDVIALFTDGEEDGLLGAEAFVSRHPWARDVRVVANFEARGNRGAVQMFETTPGNQAIVQAWAGADPSPTGASLAYEVYKRLPNDSDFTEFKRLNSVGLNFAFIGHVEAYHTPRDTAEALDQGSLQAHGNAALAIARRLGDADLDLRGWRGRDAVYFSVPGGLWFVSYSVLWTIPIAALAFVVWVWVLVRARRATRASIGGVVLAVVVLAAFLAFEVWLGFKASAWIVRFQRWWNPVASPLPNPAYAGAVACAAAAGWLILHSLLRRWFAPHTLLLAAVFPVLAAGAALAVLLPGASYLAAWPALAALAATAMLPQIRGTHAYGPGTALLAAVLAAPALAILVPTAQALVGALLLTPEGSAGLVAMIGIGAATMLPQVEIVTEGRRTWPGLLVFLVGIGAAAAGVSTAGHAASHPRPENLFYALDADAGRAVWATQTDPPGAWLAQFVTASPARGPLALFSAVAGTAPYSSHEAPAIGLPPPVVTLAGTANEGGGRLIRLRIASSRGARAVSVRIPDREIVETVVDGRPVVLEGGARSWSSGRWGLDYAGVPPEGVDLSVRVKGTAPVTFIVVDRSEGTPAIPDTTFEPRPPASQPIHRGDLTLVQRAFTF